MQSYMITSLNIATHSLTVLLVVNDYKLQEDILVVDFEDIGAIQANILKRITKLQQDSIKAPKQVPISQELQDLIGREIVIK